METKEECRQILIDMYAQMGRYPKKSDFTAEQVARIKSFYGPWPRALEAVGILPDRSEEREALKRKKRIEKKRRITRYKHG